MKKPSLFASVYAATILVISCLNHAQAITINIDLGEASVGGGSGTSSFGGDAGVSGFWNSIPVTTGTSLTDASSATTTATVSTFIGVMTSGMLVTTTGPAPPTTSVELTDDGLFINNNDINAIEDVYGFDISLLPANTYDIYLYPVTVSGMDVPTGSIAIEHSLGTEMLASVTDGTTIMLSNVNVSDGYLRITGSCPESFLCGFSGVQLVGAALKQCNDGIDNDGDTLIDHPNDSGCTDIFDDDEIDPPQCNDGIDNDGDTLIDFPIDGGCTDALDDDEAGPFQCGDGIDNDGDTLIDFPNDTGCTDALDDDEVNLPQCSDLIDNDGDTLIDFPDDGGCSFPADDSEIGSGSGGGGGNVLSSPSVSTTASVLMAFLLLLIGGWMCRQKMRLH